MEFISNCDLYLIDYSVLKPMAQELLTKPPHPCIIDNRLREQIIEYNRHSVYSNLSAIQGYKERNERIPETVFIELLHHTSAMLLSKYFNFCGCSDLDSYNILTSYIESMIQTQTGESSEFSNEDAVVRLHCDMRRYGITENELYEVLRSDVYKRQVYLRLLLLGHDGPHDLSCQFAALGKLLEPLRLRQRRRRLLAVHRVEK